MPKIRAPGVQSPEIKGGALHACGHLHVRLHNASIHIRTRVHTRVQPYARTQASHTVTMLPLSDDWFVDDSITFQVGLLCESMFLCPARYGPCSPTTADHIVRPLDLQCNQRHRSCPVRPYNRPASYLRDRATRSDCIQLN